MTYKMNLCFSLLVLSLFLTTTLFVAALDAKPEQIHLSYGKSPNEIIVTWVTFDPTNISTVEYGPLPNVTNKVKFGTVSKFVDGGYKKRVLWIHKVVLDDLVPGSEYVYYCGSTDGWSTMYEFTALKNGTDWSPTLVVYGDLGSKNARSLPQVQEEVQRGLYDAVLHVGDIAYNLDSNNARVGDEFMRQIEPIAARIPYQVCVGNHEKAYNFSNYVNRFNMMNQDGEINNHFYSFDIGPAHIIAFSTEFYYYTKYGSAQIANQYNWLENELKKANLPENKIKHPWIITMGHRPMYCSSVGFIIQSRTHCTKKDSKIRKVLEDLFYKYGVDLEIWGHQHNYERSWPVYNLKVYNGSYDAPYTNPKAPVHIITGSAGCKEMFNTFVHNPGEWSAARFSDYGFTRLNIINKTHLYTEQVSVDRNGTVIDTMLLIKDKHGPEAWL
ncbi:acid phosphatase type 7 [Parasteatoda tepidariorum]|uniref:acid phosphatase type 7 n=1 Tax=Parasteatoda tepidariorum TaxID=114398 RepID=UPI001C717FF9|nr:acid phosphatase type 7-like [Parasteatoda tepidariorum]